MGLHRVGHDWSDLACTAAIGSKAKANIRCFLAKWIRYIKITVCHDLVAFSFVMLEKAMATHSSTLAWQIPWTEEPGRQQSRGLLGVGHDWVTSLSLFTFMHWEMATHSSVLAWRIPGTGEPGGLPSMGSHRVGHDWGDLAAAAAAAAEWHIHFYSWWMGKV